MQTLALCDVSYTRHLRKTEAARAAGRGSPVWNACLTSDLQRLLQSTVLLSSAPAKFVDRMTKA